jgi:hypothetical protein
VLNFCLLSVGHVDILFISPPVLWPHQHAGVLKSCPLEPSTLTLYHCGRQDWHYMLWEPAASSTTRTGLWGDP